MVTINNFCDKLGNQLFQIAAGYAFAKENGFKFALPKEWKYQRYFKTKFGIVEKFMPDGIHKELDFSYSPIPVYDNVYLDGYFQSEKYFKNIDIHELFAFEREMKRFNQEDQIGSIHVRRGDYLKFPDHHPVCTREYYKKAIEVSGFKKFIVFSDDKEWCCTEFIKESNYGDCEFWLCDKGSDIDDFQLMTDFKCNIISNSTFSWWSAMLNKNKDKLVISPSKDNWHGPAYAHWNHDDIIPESWIQIKF